MQEVIIYRNPLEAAMWSAVQDGSILPLVIACIVFFIVLLTIDHLMPRKWNRYDKNQYKRNAANIVFSGLISIFVVYLLT